MANNQGDIDKRLKEIAEMPMFGHRFSGYAGVVNDTVQDEARMMRFLGGRIGMGGEESGIPAEVRQSKTRQATEVVSQHRAGLADELDKGHPRRRGGANDDGRTQEGRAGW